MIQEVKPSQSHTIVVTGVGQAFAQPCQATVILGVSTTAPTASDAVKRNSSSMNSVMAVIRQMGIPESEIETSTFNLRPQYSRRQQSERRLVGFNVISLTRVTTASTRVSELLDKAVEAGANQINTITFTFQREKRKELEAEARRKAVADAQRKAEIIASSLGVNIVGVINAIEGNAPSSLVRMRSTLSESPPISPSSEAVL